MSDGVWFGDPCPKVERKIKEETLIFLKSKKEE